LHYQQCFKQVSGFPAELNTLTNEEAGIALCLGRLAYDPMNIRIGAELLSSKKCRPETIARLAIQERCQAVVGYIATCGKQVEPTNPTWDTM
jgi:hypothetical protein